MKDKIIHVLKFEKKYDYYYRHRNYVLKND